MTELVVPDDIETLKRERQELIQQRVILRAKLARYAEFSKRTRPIERSP
jgi:hypothetical protein